MFVLFEVWLVDVDGDDDDDVGRVIGLKDDRNRHWTGSLVDTLALVGQRFLLVLSADAMTKLYRNGTIRS